mgnify:CR=1 FL=1
MSTKNIVPRADGEGSLGTAAKRWGDVQSKKVTSEGEVSAGSVSSTGAISGASADITGEVSAGSVSSTGAISGASVVVGGKDVASILLVNNAGAHNGIFRGKYLGSSLTETQSAAIQAGTFDDLYIGDYWTINGVDYVIVAFDYYYNTGDTACTTHHAVIVPRAPLYNAQMNTSDVTTGAYIGSAMYKSNLNQAKTAITNAFGSGHLLTIRQHFQNAVTSDYESGSTWYDATVWLMAEANVYGSNVFKSHRNGTSWVNWYSIDNRQYPYFHYAPLIENRGTYWLRDVAASTDFAFVHSLGSSNATGASKLYGVRPAFCIKG